MTLRTRIALLSAGSVAVAVLLASAVIFLQTRGQLREQIDRSLVNRVEPRALVQGRRGPAPTPGEFFLQFVGPRGETVTSDVAGYELPVTERDREVARGEADFIFRDATVQDRHLRILTTRVSTPQGRIVPGAVMVARPLTEVDEALRDLTALLLLVVLGGVAVAGALGSLVARSAVRPVERLTGAAEHVAATQDLGSYIEVDRSDELGRLAASFNTMLAALAASRDQQRRLISDASHELRTPLTSLRTNIEVLQRQDGLDPGDRERLLADVRQEFEELSAMVAELVDLATGAETSEDLQDVRLDELARDVAERARRRTGVPVEVDADAVVTRGRPTLLSRALTNLVDNACKWSPEGDRVDVFLRGGRVSVRDRGPGIDPVDRPHVFERFYRAEAARTMPGSGLGLAIVEQAIEAHGGEVFIHDPEDGPGVVVGFELPGAETVPG